jgi:2-dehydropantoate 2-reductase
MRVAVVGTGGLGGLYGGLLARAGLDVMFIARSRSVQTLREQGLQVRLSTGDEFHLPIQVTDDPHTVGPVDLVWFCVKTYDLEAAAHQAVPLIGPETMALPIQNGVEAPDRLAEILGRQHALGGVGLAGATLVAPGRVEQKGGSINVAFGELDGGTSTRTTDLARVLAGAGITPILSQDIQVDLWDKFVQACALFGLDSLLRMPDSTYLEHRETAELMRGLMQETYDVGRAHGVKLPADAVERIYTRVLGMLRHNPGMHTSMYYDILAGRRLEIEAASGAVVRLGRSYGVATPLSFAIYAALKPFAAGRPDTA